MFNWKLFAELGKKLLDELDSPQFRDVVRAAVEANGWFTSDAIRHSVESICHDMLTEQALRQWLACESVEASMSASEGASVAEPVAELNEAKNIGVIMAGNIPLVGFFDMMCVLVCRHNCYIKPSSKDRVLIEYVVRQIKDIDPQAAVFVLDNMSENDARLDAVIATGSDASAEIFRAAYSDRPALIRGSRSSVAVITGAETGGDIERLASDIFMYNGMGCRNVSHLFVPRGYDMEAFCRQLAQSVDRLKMELVSAKYLNNNRQRRALNLLEGVEFLDGGFFTMRESQPPGRALSEVTYYIYNGVAEVAQYLTRNECSIQCVVSIAAQFLHESLPLPASLRSRMVMPGDAQHPGLQDYPDGIDVIDFIMSST